MNEERKQTIEQPARATIERYLCAARHVPLFDNEGISAWYARTVPVGKRFARFAADGQFSLATAFGLSRL